MDERSSINEALREAAAALDACARTETFVDAVAHFARLAGDVLAAGGRLMACGNGGSLSQATHFAQEWTGRFRHDRRALPALAFSDPTQLSCIANDYGFDEVFARQVEAQGRSGDLLLLLSTSGSSANVIRAARAARSLRVHTVGLLGRSGGKLAGEVDVPIVVPRATTSDRIQEIHLQVLHSVIEAVERRLFPESYGSES
ncbi:MAG: SIS domain-containing protein [Deltaproteobacteria bacterium]|jgi:D-sedoheptulose 7-phosphate isomerase|nr:SIS domain-containing protein [Deltaproteobacteria bacterium]MBW2495881.1 SIS domain-containing protein [Deltaproteobacteria bacterium]